MLTRDAKENWIAALRSGEYKQAVGQLCKLNPGNTKSYCCLGVYLKAVEDIDVPDLGPNDDDSFDRNDGRKRNGDLYMKVRKEVADNYINILTMMNDRYANFSDIADYIEREIPVMEDNVA